MISRGKVLTNLPNSLVYISQKCAIDRHLRPPTFAPLSAREGPYSVLKCLSMAHFFKNMPPGGIVNLCRFGACHNVVPLWPKLRFPRRGFFSEKCAIDRHLSTEYGPSLAERGAKVGGLKCLSMAHFWEIYTSEFDAQSSTDKQHQWRHGV